jgi:hypothetical protein
MPDTNRQNMIRATLRQGLGRKFSPEDLRILEQIQELALEIGDPILLLQLSRQFSQMAEDALTK